MLYLPDEGSGYSQHCPDEPRRVHDYQCFEVFTQPVEKPWDRRSDSKYLFLNSPVTRRGTNKHSWPHVGVSR